MAIDPDVHRASTTCRNLRARAASLALGDRDTRGCRPRATRASASVSTSAFDGEGRALSLAFDHSSRDEWAAADACGRRSSPATCRASGGGSTTHALYLAIAHATGLTIWRDWPPPLRDRDRRRSDEARRNLSREVLRHQYLQWIAETQWQRARVQAHAARRHDVRRLAVHGGRRRPRRVGATGRIHARRVGWACRPTRSARRGRTGDCRPTSGIASPRPALRGCASARDAWPRSTTAIASIISSGCTGRSAVRRQGEPFFTPCDEPAQTPQGETLLEILARDWRHDHRRGPRRGS